MDEQLEQLKETVVRLLRRQEELEARIQTLEAVRRANQPPPMPVYARQPAPPLPVQAQPPPLPSFPPPPPRRMSVAPAPPPQPRFETTFGLNWINRIAVVTLILGMGFLFKYGVDNDWFGPGVRVGMGVFAAAVVLFAGDRLWRRHQIVFATGITGMGLALAYLSIYAASSLYHLVPQNVAFIVMTAITAGAGWLALQYESQAVAVLALLGGYLTPVMLSTGEDHPWILFSYVFLLNLGGLTLAKMRRWRALEWVTLAGTVVLYAGWFFEWFNAATRPVATLFAILFYAQFALAEMAGVWACAQFLASCAIAAAWDREAQFVPWELLFVSGGLMVAGLRKWTDAAGWTLICYWVPFWIWIETGGTLVNRDLAFAWLCPAFLLFFLWTPVWSVVQKSEVRAMDLTMLAGNAATFFAAGYFLLDPVHHQHMGLFAIAVGGLHLALAGMLPSSDTRLLALGVSIAFAALAVPIQFTGFHITIAWALEAAALAWIASRVGPAVASAEWLRWGSAALFSLVLTRLLLVDAWFYPNGGNYSTIANARFLAFAVSAASLWLAALWTRAAPIREWSYWAAGGAYVAGHFVLLWGLGLEVEGWVYRSVVQQDQTSTLALSLSLLMGIYSVTLVTAGVLTRTSINRILGLGLVSLVIVKLYLIDVWQLSHLFRITAFLALGGLLLATSYLYSRFKPSLERLWRPDPQG